MVNLTRWRRQLKSGLLVHSAICDALAPEAIEDACRRAKHTWRRSFWSPTMTVVTFLLQVVDGATTLRAAVATLLVQLAARGDTELPSADPTAYCQARRRLPGVVFAQAWKRGRESLMYIHGS